MSKINSKQDALDYYSQGQPGKIKVIPAKAVNSQRNLVFAYFSKVDSTLLPKHSVAKFNIQPGIALLSYTNFGYDNGLVAQKVRKVINNSLLKDNFPFSRLADSAANILLFPRLESVTIAYKILRKSGETEVVWPVLLRLNKLSRIVYPEGSVRKPMNNADQRYTWCVA